MEKINLTLKQAKLLLSMKGFDEDRKLFDGSFDKFEAKKNESVVEIKYSKNGRPGYLKKKFPASTIDAILNIWLNNPILNRSGLASLIWNDNIPNKLRRRLEQKAQRNTLTEDEMKKIISVVKNFLNSVEKSTNIY